MWLLADDTITVYFLHFAVCISDDPVPADEFCRDIAAIRYGDCVGKNIPIRFWLGLVIDIAGCYLDLNIALAFIHCSILTHGACQMVTQINEFLNTYLFGP